MVREILQQMRDGEVIMAENVQYFKPLPDGSWVSVPWTPGNGSVPSETSVYCSVCGKFDQHPFHMVNKKLFCDVCYPKGRNIPTSQKAITGISANTIETMGNAQDIVQVGGL